MSTYKIREQRATSDGGYDVIHRETEAGLVLTEDGSTVEARLAALDTAMADYIDDLEALIGGGV